MTCITSKGHCRSDKKIICSEESCICVLAGLFFIRLQTLSRFASDHTDQPCCLSWFMESVLMVQSCLLSLTVLQMTTVDVFINYWGTIIGEKVQFRGQESCLFRNRLDYRWHPAHSTLCLCWHALPSHQLFKSTGKKSAQDLGDLQWTKSHESKPRV